MSAADRRPRTGAAGAVAQYKRILRAVLDDRPSGTRQRLALALGKNRSFITQLTSPVYAVPIPQQHVATILEVCQFASAQRRAFLVAYGAAHGGKPPSAQPPSAEPSAAMRTVTLSVPDLGSADRNRLVDRMIDELALRMVRFARQLTPPP
jgi:hypothetical protein